jgi:hypothetical protein
MKKRERERRKNKKRVPNVIRFFFICKYQSNDQAKVYYA